tara:strand:- start:151 stop:1203 length:1053 start_codon:yes stop_codon:yes gene_type:complete
MVRRRKRRNIHLKLKKEDNINIKVKLNNNVIFSNGIATLINIILIYFYVFFWYNKDNLLNTNDIPISNKMQNYFKANNITPKKNTSKGGKYVYYISNVLIIILFLIYNILFIGNFSAVNCNGTKWLWSESIYIVIINFVFYILFLILILNKLSGFFQPFSNIIGYTLLISPILRELMKLFLKIFPRIADKKNIHITTFEKEIKKKSGIKHTLLFSTRKKITKPIFDIHDTLKTLLLNPKDGGDIIDKILEDPSIFIKNLSHHNVEDIIEKLKTEKRKIIKEEKDWKKEIQDDWLEEEKILFEEKNINIVNELKKILKFRDSISYFIWLIIGVSLFMTSNISYIYNMNKCG